MQCLRYWRLQGIDLGGYNTVPNAQDLKALRRHLRVAKLVLLGTSYGAGLALEALRLMGKRIARVILSSVRGVGRTYQLPGRADEYVSRLQQAVDGQPAARAAYPDIAALIRRVQAQLERRPVRVRLRMRNGATIPYLLQRHGLQLLAASLIADPGTAARMLAVYRSLERGRDPDLEQIPARWLPDHLADPGRPIALQGISVLTN